MILGRNNFYMYLDKEYVYTTVVHRICSYYTYLPIYDHVCDIHILDVIVFPHIYFSNYDDFVSNFLYCPILFHPLHILFHTFNILLNT